MPHKHKRKREGGEGDYELPPSQRARPLPVGNSKQSSTIFTSDTKKKRKNKNKGVDNDTPRAFRRIMAAAQGKKTRSGLDDGVESKPKSDRDLPNGDLKIRPGEDMRSFSARVDAALPVSGLTRKTVTKDGKDEQGFKVWRTTKERKMHKLYAEWHEEERKIRERREEELEEAAARELENDAAGITSSAFLLDDDNGSGRKKKGKKGKKGKDEDPWAVLLKKRAEKKAGLHDVVQAPPELHKEKTRHLKVRNATVDVGNIPKASGSLRRREELQAERDDVLEAYRKIREHEQRKLTGKRS
ncbi:hypothetical protein NLU13_1671 [Sarocladium strictum]|uniref:Urease accessory protein UreD n=1 Tax=Sarocladium strictum TaxID=5046 RepID=A0AA39GSZ7_SARSR|nr:hypothetical protein NLU13_1671 [Sarocladium strictum]